MTILSLNCGSSSIKAAAFAGSSLERIVVVRVEGIGADRTSLRVDGEIRALAGERDFAGAVRAVLDAAQSSVEGPITAVVHRIVHGGERFARPTLLGAHALEALDALSSLAPLHNPPAMSAVRAAMSVFQGVPQFAVFDTSFHATLPRRAREYALPKDVREGAGIRRYGFHGISHEHLMKRVASELRTNARALRIISCHLGNGASVAAIEYGRSIDTSMGMTPLEGLVMGSRCGDVDPGAVLELMRARGLDDTRALLTKNSGLVGMTGTHDMRSIEERAALGDEECRLALNVFAYRVRKYIGAYAASMGGVDAIAFTGGIGEHSPLVRHRCLQRLDFLGAVLDEDRNRDALEDSDSTCAELSAEHSRVRLFAVRADEERAMAEAIVPLLDADRPSVSNTRIPIAVSARHAHLSQATLERLFGAGFELQPRKALSQTGQFAASATVTLIGPRGRLENVRLMGPPRNADQIEISRSDEFVLGVDAPVRMSGDLPNTPGITLEGPKGRVTIANGVIAAKRHIHMSVADAQRLRVKDHDVVAVRIDSEGRDLTFADVAVRVDPSFRLELHLDTDEANAAGVAAGDYAELLLKQNSDAMSQTS